MTKTKILGIILFFSVLANIYLAVNLVLCGLQLKDAERAIRTQQHGEKASYFARLFVENVMSGKGEVGFEDRLKMENAVRDIEDAEILQIWQNFTNSASDGDAQIQAGRLLSELLEKIQP